MTAVSSRNCTVAVPAAKSSMTPKLVAPKPRSIFWVSSKAPLPLVAVSYGSAMVSLARRGTRL